MKKPEVIYVRSGYLPLREPRELAPQKGIFSSRAHTIISELKESTQEFERRCAAVSIRLEEEKLRRLAPLTPKKTHIDVDLEDEEQSERLKLLKKILRLERRNARMDKELIALRKEIG